MRIKLDLEAVKLALLEFAWHSGPIGRAQTDVDVRVERARPPLDVEQPQNNATRGGSVALHDAKYC